jgi:carbon storage regulator CsrA
MLVLSRRPNEEILLPELGISIKVAKIQGNSVRLAIDAPKQVRIVRAEIKDVPKATDAEDLSHELRNRLNELTLALQLFKRQRGVGKVEDAAATAEKIMQVLDQMHRQSPPSRPVRKGGLKIMVVEDNDNERELLAALLKMNGCQVISTADGIQALQHLMQGARPDFVLMDMRMPRCDGVQTLRKIRSNPSIRDLLIFAMSGCPQSDFDISIGPEGFNGWFPKPLNPSQLWERIQWELKNCQN